MKKKNDTPEVEKETEAERVVKHRRAFFSEELPELEDSQIQRLVAASHASPHDVRKLRAKGCSPYLCLEILV